MPRPVALGRQIAGVVRICRELVGDPLGDRHALRLQSSDLGRVIGHQPDRLHPEQRQHPRRHRKIARFGGQAEAVVGVHRVKALVLQPVGAQLVDQTDAAAFLPQI